MLNYSNCKCCINKFDAKLTLIHKLPADMCRAISEYYPDCEDCSEIMFWTTDGLRYILPNSNEEGHQVTKYNLMFKFILCLNSSTAMAKHHL